MARDSAYILITAAKNEELYIAQTIQAVLNQAILPRKWVIVSDGSRDRTNEIVRKFEKNHSFIEFISLPPCGPRNFASKVRAINLAYSQVRNIPFEFVGNLDADITFDANYYSRLITKFQQRPSLGIAGGYIYENLDGTFRSRPSNSRLSVAGAVQMFSRRCYDDIGGHKAISIGGEDRYLEIVARMRNWEVLSFPDLPAYHHKVSKRISTRVIRGYKSGMVDYAFNTQLMFFVFKCLRRLKEKPYVLISAAWLLGFGIASLRRDPKVIPPEVSCFVRKEQLQRLRTLLLHPAKNIRGVGCLFGKLRSFLSRR